MDFRSYWSNQAPEQKDAFARSIKHSRNYLDQIACGARQPSHKLAKKLNEATEGVVTLHALRPDIWSAPADIASTLSA
jgi:DNA-binding transcriptional regulator YdaS (Cro superfamily)